MLLIHGKHKNMLESVGGMIFSDKFGTVDPIVGCQLPRIIICLNEDKLRPVVSNIFSLTNYCESQLKERYQNCIITVLATSPNDIKISPDSIVESSILHVGLFNIFNIQNAHYYTENQITIEVNAAIKRFTQQPVNTLNNNIDSIGQKLSKMLVVSTTVNDLCENNLFKDGETISCLDHKGNPLVFSSTGMPTAVELGYAIFNADGEILSVLHESITPNKLIDFLTCLHNMQNTVESHYSKFMSSKVMSFLNGKGSFSDCDDIDYAKDVCKDLLDRFETQMNEIVPSKYFSSSHNLKHLIDIQFGKSIKYSVLDFTSEIQDFCRLRD